MKNRYCQEVLQVGARNILCGEACQSGKRCHEHAQDRKHAEKKEEVDS